MQAGIGSIDHTVQTSLAELPLVGSRPVQARSRLNQASQGGVKLVVIPVILQ